MSFLDFSDYKVGGEKGWMINKEENVLIYIISGFELYRAWGAGNCATRVAIEDGYILRNIYVKKECRNRGIFRKYMDDIYMALIGRNLGLFLLPCPYEFTLCPFENPEKARVVQDYEDSREYLYKKYIDMGFYKIKTGYYNMDSSYKSKVVNTMICGENRKAARDELFAPIKVEKNYGFHWLGAATHSIIPEEVFLQENGD